MKGDSGTTTFEDGLALAEGVGGRLSVDKSAAFRRILAEVESRAVPFVMRYMVASDLAYVLSAHEAGLVGSEDSRELVGALLELLDLGPTAFEGKAALDVLTLREAWIIERLGPEVGSQLHLARNRTESLKHYLPKLFFRDSLSRQRTALLDLIEALTEQGERHRETVAPVYHHLQHAMVATLGEYLLSWAANLVPHLDRIREADGRLDIAPSVNNERPGYLAIGGGVSRRLGFTRTQLVRHQQHATEDQFSEPFFVLVATNVALARLAEDFRIWMTTEFDFFEPHDRHASGSSGLPQKKNPFALQAVIGGASVGAGRLAAQLTTSIAPSEGLESAFAAASLYQQADDSIAYTAFMAELVRDATFNVDELEKKSFIGDAMISEVTDVLVFDHGVPFRLAHHALGALVRARLAGEVPPPIVAPLEERLGRKIDVTDEQLFELLGSHDIPETSRTPVALERGLEMLKGTLASERARTGTRPVDDAIEALVAEARGLIQHSTEGRS